MKGITNPNWTRPAQIRYFERNRIRQQSFSKQILFKNKNTTLTIIYPTRYYSVNNHSYRGSFRRKHISQMPTVSYCKELVWFPHEPKVRNTCRSLKRLVPWLQIAHHIETRNKKVYPLIQLPQQLVVIWLLLSNASLKSTCIFIHRVYRRFWFKSYYVCT